MKSERNTYKKESTMDEVRFHKIAPLKRGGMLLTFLISLDTTMGVILVGYLLIRYFTSQSGLDTFGWYWAIATMLLILLTIAEASSLIFRAILLTFELEDLANRWATVARKTTGKT